MFLFKIFNIDWSRSRIIPIPFPILLRFPKHSLRKKANNLYESFQFRPFFDISTPQRSYRLDSHVAVVSLGCRKFANSVIRSGGRWLLEVFRWSHWRWWSKIGRRRSPDISLNPKNIFLKFLRLINGNKRLVGEDHRSWLLKVFR